MKLIENNEFHLYTRDKRNYFKKLITFLHFFHKMDLSVDSTFYRLSLSLSNYRSVDSHLFVDLDEFVLIGLDKVVKENLYYSDKYKVCSEYAELLYQIITMLPHDNLDEEVLTGHKLICQLKLDKNKSYLYDIHEKRVTPTEYPKHSHYFYTKYCCGKYVKLEYTSCGEYVKCKNIKERKCYDNLIEVISITTPQIINIDNGEILFSKGDKFYSSNTFVGMHLSGSYSGDHRCSNLTYFTTTTTPLFIDRKHLVATNNKETMTQLENLFSKFDPYPDHIKLIEEFENIGEVFTGNIDSDSDSDIDSVSIDKTSTISTSNMDRTFINIDDGSTISYSPTYSFKTIIIGKVFCNVDNKIVVVPSMHVCGSESTIRNYITTRNEKIVYCLSCRGVCSCHTRYIFISCLNNTYKICSRDGERKMFIKIIDFFNLYDKSRCEIKEDRIKIGSEEKDDDDGKISTNQSTTNPLTTNLSTTNPSTITTTNTLTTNPLTTNSSIANLSTTNLSTTNLSTTNQSTTNTEEVFFRIDLTPKPLWKSEYNIFSKNNLLKNNIIIDEISKDSIDHIIQLLYTHEHNDIIAIKQLMICGKCREMIVFLQSIKNNRKYYCSTCHYLTPSDKHINKHIYNICVCNTCQSFSSWDYYDDMNHHLNKYGIEKIYQDMSVTLDNEDDTTNSSNSEDENSNQSDNKQIEKKRSIPKKLRVLVWEKHNGRVFDGKCFCCDGDVDFNANYHCSHIVSRANGGEITADNLRPACQRCNLSMGTENII